MLQKEWFATWFDSPYYHLLYQHRDDNEAQLFLNKLIGVLELKPSARILDLACGKGRHSITLAQMGFAVLGADLAANSIAAAQENQKALQLDKLQFVVHDMRKPIQGQSFAAIFNLFTSFGYFDTLEENQAVCKALASMLQPEGVVVIDFLNGQLQSTFDIAANGQIRALQKAPAQKEIAVPKPTPTTNNYPPRVVHPKTKGLRFVPNGYNKVYNDNDEIWMDGEFKSGQLYDGKVYDYDKDGILQKVRIYKLGKYHSDGQL